MTTGEGRSGVEQRVRSLTHCWSNNRGGLHLVEHGEGKAAGTVEDTQLLVYRSLAGQPVPLPLRNLPHQLRHDRAVVVVQLWIRGRVGEADAISVCELWGWVGG